MMEPERDPLAQIRSQTAAVIPAYQDEKHIGDIVRRTRERLDHVVVVDDGSTDQTAQRAREAGAEVIVHNQNCGKGEAIKTGLGHWFGAASSSSSELNRQIRWVSLLDSDGQHLPEEIDRFITAAVSATRPSFFIGNRMKDRFDYDTEVLIIASRKGYRIESVPITTVYSDQVSKIRPLRDSIRFFELMWRYRKL